MVKVVSGLFYFPDHARINKLFCSYQDFERNQMPLTTKQRQYLKGLGHSLKPVIQVGKEGLTDRVIASISKALLDHELIKINILETALLERNEAAEEISTELKAEIVQILGRKVLLYRKNPEKAKIQLPEFFNKK